MSVIRYEGIFQDIVKRCEGLDDIEVVAAWTCTKMRPDGFGGMAKLINADAIETMSNAAFLDDSRHWLYAGGQAAETGRVHCLPQVLNSSLACRPPLDQTHYTVDRTYH